MELREWQYISKPTGNTTSNSSGGYKKRFEKLIKYHIDHASSELESITAKDIRDNYFRLSEHYNNAGGYEFDRDIIVSYDKDSDTIFLRIFVDGKEVYSKLYDTYEDCLQDLSSSYMYLPDGGTQEYDALLVESLNEWHLMNPPKSSQPASSTTLYKDKFKKLLDYHLSNDYHIKHGSSQGTVELLSEDSDKALFKYRETWEDGGGNKHETITGIAYFKKDASWWILRMIDGEQKESIDGNDFNELVKKLYRYFTLPPTNSSEYQALLEEVDSAIANDFKTYENLWD